MEHKHIELDIQGKVATLFLNRQPRNLLNIAMMDEVNDALLALRDLASLQILVLRGRGGIFSEGLDLKEHAQKKVQRMLHVYLRIFETIRMMDVVSLAAVEGRAWGAGFELALGCNLIVASETASFALPQVSQGIIPPVATAILPRVAPRRRAMEWILTGSEISARRLEQDGVVGRLFPPHAFEESLAGFLGELTSKSGPVLQLAKRAQFEGYYGTFVQALASIQTMYLRELMTLEDAKEGPKALREGRDPVWQDS